MCRLPVIRPLLLIAGLLAATGVNAQSLSPGDLAIVGLNMDDFNEFSFVAFVDIPAGTEIRFTDNGWTATGVFREEEDTMVYVAPVDLVRGTVVVVNGTVGRVPGLATAGDQLFAYQLASDGTPRFIYGINNTPGGGWQDDAVNDQATTLPTQLIDGFTAVSLPHCDNVVYTGVAIGRQAELLIFIANAASWTCQDAFHLNLALPPFTVTGILNSFPVFTTVLPDTTLRVGEILDFRYEAVDPDGQVVFFTTGQLPTGAIIAPTSGVLRWIPVEGQIGTHLVRIGASDGISTAFTNATVTVVSGTSVDAAPAHGTRTELHVWPNPAFDQVRVSFEADGHHVAELRVHDLLGRLHHASPFLRDQTELDLSSWPPGTYLVTVSRGRQRTTSLLTVSR